MEKLIAELYKEADILLFDSPPVLSVTDSAVLAPRVDGTLFVVHVGKTRRDALLQAVSFIRKTNAQVLGIVLNRIKPSHSRYYYYYEYYNTYARDNDKQNKRRRRRIRSRDRVSAPS
jgi:Mrp family chromosome partitioning ATPase